VDVIPESKEDPDACYDFHTLEQLEGMREWARICGYRYRWVVDEKALAQAQIMDDFFNL
jgi:hypothetical protein